MKSFIVLFAFIACAMAVDLLYPSSSSYVSSGWPVSGLGYGYGLSSYGYNYVPSYGSRYVYNSPYAYNYGSPYAYSLLKK